MENSNYRAIVNENNCFGNGDCIKVCEVKAIEEGPKRFSMACGAAELLPGKELLSMSKFVTDVAIVLLFVAIMQLKRWLFNALRNCGLRIFGCGRQIRFACHPKWSIRNPILPKRTKI